MSQDTYYLNTGIDRALLAHEHAIMLLERREPTGDPLEDQETMLDAVASGAGAWALPMESDPMQVDQTDATALYLWLKSYVLGTTH